MQKSNLFTLFSALFLILAAGTINKNIKQAPIKVDMQDKAINIQESFISLFAFGQERLIADFLWIITLLDGDLSHYKQSDKNSWMYLRFNLISVLDPQFKRNYVDGGKYLTIVKDDIIGGIDLLNKGIYYFPDDYEINSQLGFVYAFEQNNYPKSLHHYKVIRKDNRTSRFIESLIIKLQYQKRPDPTLLKNIIKHHIDSNPKSLINKKLKHDLILIQQDIDLACLNQKMKNCSKRDPWGNLYPKKGETFTYFDESKRYKIHKKVAQ